MTAGNKAELLDFLHMHLGVGRVPGAACTKSEVAVCTQILLSATLRCAGGAQTVALVPPIPGSLQLFPCRTVDV